MGIGGVLWEYRRRYKSWKINLGLGLTVTEGEMEGVGRFLKEVLEYEGELRKLVVGVDNTGVLKRLLKGRGMCGECKQGVREKGCELIRRGWEIRWEWVPGHVGVRENEEVDGLAKEGVFMEEDRGIGDLLTWGKWEKRRKKEKWRVWKEFWDKKRKGRKYFGRGKGREIGHGGSRMESMFLFWMRTGHRKVRGTRYGKEDKRCKCGSWESRDHVLLECERWRVQREGIFDKWEEERGVNRERVDMDWLLFEEGGVEALKEFGKEKGWMKQRWNERVEYSRERRWSREEEGERLRRRKVLTGERARRKRKRDLEMGRNRMRRRRAIEKLEREGLGRETLPIASNVPLGAGPGRKRKVFGEVVNEAVMGGRKNRKL